MSDDARHVPQVTWFEDGLVEQAFSCLHDILGRIEPGITPTWTLECDCGCEEDLMIVTFRPVSTEI